jgi:hypothetical protein
MEIQRRQMKLCAKPLSLVKQLSLLVLIATESSTKTPPTGISLFVRKKQSRRSFDQVRQGAEERSNLIKVKRKVNINRKGNLS